MRYMHFSYGNKRANIKVHLSTRGDGDDESKTNF